MEKLTGKQFLDRACDREQILINMGFVWHPLAAMYSWAPKSHNYSYGIRQIDILSWENDEFENYINDLKFWQSPDKLEYIKANPDQFNKPTKV